MNMICGLIFLAWLGQTPSQGGTAAAKDAGVVSLFNGKDLTGWTDALDNAGEWRVEGGILEGRGGGKGQPAVLVTDRQDFANYRLRVTFSLPTAGGGGIEVRRTGDPGVTSSYWVSAAAPPDWQATQRPSGNVTKIREFRYGVSPLPPARDSARINTGAKQWHTLIVTVSGNRIATTVNGRPADDYTDAKQGHRSGGITLFCRGDSIIRVRDVQIQELPAE